MKLPFSKKESSPGEPKPTIERSIGGGGQLRVIIDVLNSRAVLVIIGFIIGYLLGRQVP